MDAATEQKIRERAYAIWQESGPMAGDADAHWLLAERAVALEGEVSKPIKAKGARKAAVGGSAKAPAKVAAPKPAKSATRPAKAASRFKSAENATASA